MKDLNVKFVLKFDCLYLKTVHRSFLYFCTYKCVQCVTTKEICDTKEWHSFLHPTNIKTEISCFTSQNTEICSIYFVVLQVHMVAVAVKVISKYCSAFFGFDLNPYLKYCFNYMSRLLFLDLNVISALCDIVTFVWNLHSWWRMGTSSTECHSFIQDTVACFMVTFLHSLVPSEVININLFPEVPNVQLNIPVIIYLLKVLE